MRELAVKITVTPKDSNSDGDVFCSWIMSMMDLAGATLAKRIAKKRRLNKISY